MLKIWNFKHFCSHSHPLPHRNKKVAVFLCNSIRKWRMSLNDRDAPPTKHSRSLVNWSMYFIVNILLHKSWGEVFGVVMPCNVLEYLHFRGLCHLHLQCDITSYYIVTWCHNLLYHNMNNILLVSKNSGKKTM